MGGDIDYRIGDWSVHPSLNRLDRDGVSVDLEPKLMDLLVCLAEHAGEVVSKETLLDRVWRVEHVSDGTLSHAVAELRRALGDDARRPEYIETIRKRGYRMVAAVSSDASPEATPDTRTETRHRHPRTVMVIALAAVLAAAASIGILRRGGEPSPPPKIVILPFENLGTEAHESFAAGLTDEIISRLASVRGLQVVSRTTAFNFDSTGKSAQDIGAELGVDYILEGAVRWGIDQEPPTVRITPQLIRVDEDGHLWSGQFNRRPHDVLDVQSEIARQIVGQLDLRLARDESEIVNTPPTDNPAAYRAYVEALERRGSFDGGDILTAAQMYRRAVDQDPDFAQAWAGLAEANGAIHHFGYDREPERCETAGRALERARELAPDAPETLRASAFFEYHCRADGLAARAAFEHALDTWPGDALAMAGMAYACRRTGRWEETELWFRRAMELDPRNPTVLWNLGSTLVSGHRYDEGLIFVDRAIELAPDLRFAHFAKCVALWLGWGDTRRAAEVLEQAPGSRDAIWYEYAFRNACYAGDLHAASEIAQESPPGRMSKLQQCLVAYFTDDPETVAVCSEAAAHYRAARDREPDVLWPRLLLTRVLSLAGLHAEALTESATMVAMKPLETDARAHVETLLVRAQILARAGRVDDAVDLVERLLATPSHLSPARLRIDPEWASLRGHPRIEEIIHSDAPMQIDHGASADSSG